MILYLTWHNFSLSMLYDILAQSIWLYKETQKILNVRVPSDGVIYLFYKHGPENRCYGGNTSLDEQPHLSWVQS